MDMDGQEGDEDGGADSQALLTSRGAYLSLTRMERLSNEWVGGHALHCILQMGLLSCEYYMGEVGLNGSSSSELTLSGACFEWMNE